MIKHPCDGMKSSEKAAFEAIAINQPPRCSKRTIDALLERGVIAKLEKPMRFRDGLPPLLIDEFYVPLPIHIQWCEWAYRKYQGRAPG
jgi:hypothetical protein